MAVKKENRLSVKQNGRNTAPTKGRNRLPFEKEVRETNITVHAKETKE